MVRIGVIVGKAISLRTVGNDICDVFRDLGHITTLHQYQIPFYEAVKLFDRAVIFIPFDPTYVLSYVLLQRDYVLNGINSFIYTTVEGVPLKPMIKSWIKRDGRFIAVSNYVKDMLEEVDIPVMDVIPHGINIRQLSSIRIDKDKIKRLTGGKVVFGVVASGIERKGLNYLAQAIKICNEAIPDAGFYVYSEGNVKPYFANLKNTFFDDRYGMLKRSEVLSLIGSFDYYICSSLCEGFGLPLLEAQALGVPVVYPEYPPLTEFTHSTANFSFPYREVKYVQKVFGIIFQYHMYDVNDMVNAIAKAYYTYLNNHDDYLERCKVVREYAYNYDCFKLYPKFGKYLEV